MPKTKRPQGSTRYQEALQTVVEEGFYVIQRRVPGTGEWRTITPEIQGQVKALHGLNSRRDSKAVISRYEYRAIQTVIAEAYAEGWKARDDLETGKYIPTEPVEEQTTSS